MTAPAGTPDDSSGVPGRTLRRRWDARVAGLRARHGWIDHLARAAAHYRGDRIEYHALVVVSRGLFLTIAGVMVFLYVLSFITDLLPGTNELVIPTATLPDARDLGSVVDEALVQFQSAVLGIVGLVTLLVSATLTARALRNGTRRVFAGDAAPQVRALAPSNLLIGLGPALMILISWLLALSTAVRTAAIGALLGADVSRSLVPVGKALTIAVAFVLIAAVVYLCFRRAAANAASAAEKAGSAANAGSVTASAPPAQLRRTTLVAAAVFAAFLTAANFLLLYSYVGALIDPHTSGGVVLVLTILTWVNAVARALFLAECWVATSAASAAARTPNAIAAASG